jgi:hypothetical protein
LAWPNKTSVAAACYGLAANVQRSAIQKKAFGVAHLGAKRFPLLAIDHLVARMGHRNDLDTGCALMRICRLFYRKRAILDLQFDHIHAAIGA